MWTVRRSGQDNQRVDDHRHPYERDGTRVIHCFAFRRLQRKTQIFGADESDFHRTRLTHSLEVASIGRSIIRNLKANPRQNFPFSILPNEDLISAICLLHDIGHPPFGHGGEVALNYMMHCHGGFEGNAQTLRLLTKIETSYAPHGLDLTRRVLLGILKYPLSYSALVVKDCLNSSLPLSRVVRINDWLPPKCYFDTEQPEVDFILTPFSGNDRCLFQSLGKAPQSNHHGQAAYKSLDCSIMDIADNIAYGVHDLEDSIYLSLIHQGDLVSPYFHELISATPFANSKEDLILKLFSNETSQSKQAISELVNYFITSTQITVTHPEFENELLKYNLILLPEASALLDYFIDCIYKHVIDSQPARIVERKGQIMLCGLFEAIQSDPKSLLTPKNRQLFQIASHSNEADAFRVICDYIATMTDDYASALYKNLFGL